eukprot:403339930
MSRPTDLNFRSPHERTPEFYDVNHTQLGLVLNPQLQKAKAFDSYKSFNTKQKRFQQYEQWARNTSMFVGPGVYDDQKVFNHLVQRPCTVKYKYDEISKDHSRDCFTVIGGNMIQYEPGFDKESFRKANQNKVLNHNDNISKLSLNSIFPQRKVNLIQNIKNMRNSQISQQQNAIQQSYGKESKRPSQSFYSENGQTFDGMQRPSTSYSLSRGQRSTQSQSRNITKMNFSNALGSFETPTSQQFMMDSNHTNKPSNSLIYRTNIRQSDQLAADQNGKFQGLHTENTRLNQSVTHDQITNPNLIYNSYQTQNPQRNNNNLLQINTDQNLMRAATSQGSRNKSVNHRRNSKVNDRQIVDLKKSITLLQAYGEYDRFLNMSKQYMKDKGIVIKKNLKKKKKRSIQVLSQAQGDNKQNSTRENPSDYVGENYKEMAQILNQKLDEQSNKQENIIQ